VVAERALEAEQLLFAAEPARVTREVAVRAHEAVARDHDREWVARVRAADGPCTLRQAESSRLFGIRPGLAVRDRREGEPGAPLEVRPDEIERELERRPPAGEVLGELLARLDDDRPRAGRLAVAPLEPLEAALGGDDPEWSDRPQRSAPSSCNSCTFRSSPPA
jgi:hypothetical protein